MNPLAPRNDAENEHNDQLEIMTDDNEIVDDHDGQTEQQPTNEPDASERAENKGAVNNDTIQTKSGRVSRPTERILESIQQQMDSIVSLFVNGKCITMTPTPYKQRWRIQWHSQHRPIRM
jgi:hypothetical protein